MQLYVLASIFILSLRASPDLSILESLAEVKRVMWQHRPRNSDQLNASYERLG